MAQLFADLPPLVTVDRSLGLRPRHRRPAVWGRLQVFTGGEGLVFHGMIILGWDYGCGLNTLKRCVPQGLARAAKKIHRPRHYSFGLEIGGPGRSRSPQVHLWNVQTVRQTA